MGSPAEGFGSGVTWVSVLIGGPLAGPGTKGSSFGRNVELISPIPT
jgi:hypothetical protein